MKKKIIKKDRLLIDYIKDSQLGIGQVIKLKRPLVFGLILERNYFNEDERVDGKIVKVKKEVDWWIANNKNLDIKVYVHDRDRIEESIQDSLEFLWREYAVVEDGCLSDVGKELKKKLMDMQK